MSSNNNRNRNNQNRRPAARAVVPAEAKTQLADHREVIVLPEDMDGWDKLKNPKKVSAANQARLMAALARLGVDTAEEGDEMSPDKIDDMADFMEFIGDRFANDTEEFEEWSATAGFQATFDLAMKYTGVLGEVLRSKS